MIAHAETSPDAASDACIGEGTVISDRRISRPYGLSGGSAAQSGANSINDTPIAGKSKVKLSRGDVLRIITPGGGGWGG